MHRHSDPHHRGRSQLAAVAHDRRWRALACVAGLAVAALLLAGPSRARVAAGRVVAADYQPTCMTRSSTLRPFMTTHHASVVRIIVYPHNGRDTLSCATTAASEGYRVYLTVQFRNSWRPAQVAAYFRRTLPAYAPYVWAVAVGNEQDLARNGGHEIGAAYRRVWNAVEPVLARVTPSAIRVYGETSPWGFKFLQASFRGGSVRGAQAIAFHCYDSKWGGLRLVPEVAAWAAGKHLPLWCSEMSAAPHPAGVGWVRRDSPLQFSRLLASVQRRSPNLRMTSFYRWPEIGAR